MFLPSSSSSFPIYSFIANHCLHDLLLFHSSLLIFSSSLGSCSLIYFYHAAWKESRREQKATSHSTLHNRHTWGPVISPPVLPSILQRPFMPTSLPLSLIESLPLCPTPKGFLLPPTLIFDPLSSFSIPALFQSCHNYDPIFLYQTHISPNLSLIKALSFLWLRRPIWGSSWTSFSITRWTKCPRCWKEALTQTTMTVRLVVRLYSVHKHKHSHTHTHYLSKGKVIY